MLQFKNTSGAGDGGPDKPGAHKHSASPQGGVHSEGVAPPIGRDRTVLLSAQTRARSSLVCGHSSGLSAVKCLLSLQDRAVAIFLIGNEKIKLINN